MPFELKRNNTEPDYFKTYEKRGIYLRLAVELIRSILVFLSFLIISRVLFTTFVGVYEMITVQHERIPRLMYLVSSLSIPFTLYSTTRSVELYDREAQIYFLSQDGRYSFKNDILAIYRTPRLRLKFLTRVGVFLFFILVLPYSVAFTPLVGCFFPEFDMPQGILNLVAKLIMCPLFLILIHLSATSAHKWWLRGTESSKEKILGTRHFVLFAFLEQLKIFVIYGISFYLLPTTFLIVVGAVLTVMLIEDYSFLIWILAIFALVVVIFYARAMKRRKRFVKQLKRLAAEEDWELSHLRHQKLSVIRPRAGYDFTLKKDGRTFSCKLLASVKRSTPTYIDYNGRVTAKVTFSLMRVELFHLLIDTDYTFEAEGEKVVIFSPAPRKIFLNMGRTDIAPDSQDMRAIDGFSLGTSRMTLMKKATVKNFQTGDRVGEYKFFTADGFISAMDNNCLHR